MFEDWISKGAGAASTSGNSVFYFNIILPQGNFSGLQFLPPCPDTMSEVFLTILNNKKWVTEKFMQSLHPLPHTNPLDGTTRKQVPREKTSLWASKLISYQPPVPASGSEVHKQKGVSRQTGTTRGPEWGSAHLEKGSAQQGQQEERDQISAQKFKQENCPGEEVEVKHFLVAQPRVFLTRECCNTWCLLSKLLADTMQSRKMN